MEYDIFISYSLEDSGIVNQFVNLLIEEGYNVWIDKEAYHFNGKLEGRIAEAIMNSTTVLFFSSWKSNESAYVLSVICYALAKRKPIIPIHISDGEYADCIADDFIDIDYIALRSVDSTMKRIVSFLSDYIDKHPSSIALNPSMKDNSPEDLFHLGKSCYDNKEYEKAVNFYELAAEQGHSGAQYSLGCCYDTGEGVEINKPEAARWYRKAAKQGHAWAQYNIGCCYDTGEGVCENHQEAAKWFRLAALQGFALAQYNLGCCFEFGEGVPRDYKEAFNWYFKAAEQGHKLAQYNVALFYEKGQGVIQNRERAVYWYRKVAEQGYAEAQYFLGLYYEAGIAVNKDFEEAVKWYRKAAEQGYYSAIKKLEKLGLQ